MLNTIDMPYNELEALPAGLQTMSPAMLDATNYYQWIADVLMPVARQRILDVGGGMGCLLPFFEHAEKLFALDIAESSVAYLKQRFENLSHCEVLLGDINKQSMQKHFITEGVDTILCTNVLEHVEHDDAMLKAFHNILAPQKGALALLVPAHQWLYGTMDVQAGHYRRYDKNKLVQQVTGAGFKIKQVRYFNALAALGWYINGRILKKSTLSDAGMNAQIRFYDKKLLPVARKIESIIEPPIGLSVIVLAEACL